MLPDEETPHSGPARGDLLAAAILFVAAFALYLPALPYAILGWDDEKYLVNNPWLLNASLANIRGLFTHSYFNNYHPLTMLSYMVDFHLFGGHEPSGYRLGNLLLHGGTCAAGFALLRTLGAGTRNAFAVMLLFAVHPLRLESVVWLSERKDVLAALFYVLAMVAWRLGSVPRVRWPWVIAAILCFLLSLFSKAMAVSFPLVVLFHDVFLAPQRLRRRWALYAALGIVAAIFMVANMRAQGTAVGAQVPFGARLGTALWAPVHYAWLTVMPVNISPLYPWELRPSQHASGVLLGLIACLAGLGAVAWSARRCPVLAWGLLSSAAILGPVSGIVAFGAAWAADRYSYLPTLFLFAGIAPALAPLLQGRPAKVRALAAGLALVLAGAYAWRTWQLMPIWQSNSALWDRVLAVFPNSRHAETNRLFQEPEAGGSVAERAVAIAKQEGIQASGELAVLRLMAAQRWDEALAAADLIRAKNHAAYWRMRVQRERGAMEAAAQEARQVIAFGEDTEAEHRANAAWTLIAAGQASEGRAALEALTEPTMAGFLAWSELGERSLNPAEREDFARRSLAIFPAEPRAIRQLGGVLLESRRLPEGRRLFRKAARHPLANPSTRGYAWAMLGRIEEYEGDRTRAAALYEKAFEPDLSTEGSVSRAATLAFLGYTAEQIGQMVRAEGLYRDALAADPTSSDAAQGLAFIRIQQGRHAEAQAILEEALLHHPDDAALRQNLDTLRAARHNPPGS